MDSQDLYRSKLASPEQAVRLIPEDGDIAMGMAVAEPPALLAALAARIARGELARTRLWYFHSMEHAARSVLRNDLLGAVRPHCMFLSRVERQLMTSGAPAREAIEFVPVAFSESPRLLSREVALDACVTTVSPMDRHGFFTFGTSNDYTSTAARST